LYVAIPVWPMIGINQDSIGRVVHTMQKGKRLSSEIICFFGELNSNLFYIASISYSVIYSINKSLKYLLLIKKMVSKSVN